MSLRLQVLRAKAFLRPTAHSLAQQEPGQDNGVAEYEGGRGDFKASTNAGGVATLSFVQCSNWPTSTCH